LGTKIKKQLKRGYVQTTQINNLKFFNFIQFKNIKKFILKFNTFYRINPSLKYLIKTKNNIISQKIKNNFYLYFQNLLNGNLKNFDKKSTFQILANFKNKNKNKFLVLVYYLILLKKNKKKKSLNYSLYKTRLEQNFLNLNKSNFNLKYSYIVHKYIRHKKQARAKRIINELSINFFRKVLFSCKQTRKSYFKSNTSFLQPKLITGLLIEEFIDKLKFTKNKITFVSLFNYFFKKLYRSFIVDKRRIYIYKKLYKDIVDREKEFTTFHKPAQIPVQRLKLKFKYLTRKQIKHRMFKFYYRISNAFERKYELENIQKLLRIKSK